MIQSSKQQKILVIDDEADYRNIIMSTLQYSGFETIDAADGVDGLASTKMHHPDLILCDVNMPKMDGHTLLRKLKEEPEYERIPFIFLTGNTGPGDLRKGMQNGADDYLTKPFTTDELVTAVTTRLVKQTKMQKFYESQFDDIKSSIVHSLPHEFRTPLNGILGFSQVLIDETTLTMDEVKDLGGMIHASGKRLHHLLENMVLYGQMQLWSHDENKIAELRNESSMLLESIRSVAENKSKEHHRPDAICLSMDDTQLQISATYLTKIIEEIIDNALKFSDPGSSVHLTSKENESEVQICIDDMGRGMSAEQIEKISGFQQFERGYYEQQGAGLGLVIAKTLAEFHGGNLSIVSKGQTGTTVCVTLPKRKAADSQSLV